MLDPQKLRDAFKRKRHGAGEYDPDFDLFDAAADEIESLRAALETATDALELWGSTGHVPTDLNSLVVEFRAMVSHR